MSKARKPRSDYLNNSFDVAVKQFGLEFQKTSTIQHSGDKGAAREEPLRRFFDDRLPRRYAVVSGEAVDLLGNTSPQMDLMFFDRNENFALHTQNSAVLAAEALLATVEVKSSLTSKENRAICESGQEAAEASAPWQAAGK